MAGPELAKDKTGVRLQVAHRKTDVQDATLTGLSSFNLATGETSAAFAYNTPVKVVSTSALIWVKVGVGATAVDTEGEPIPASTWEHMTVNAGERIAIIGGNASIIPIVG